MILTDSEGNAQEATWTITVQEDAAGAAPDWRNLPRHGTPASGFIVGQNISLNLDNYVAGNPAPVITMESGTLPPGITFSDGTVSGQITGVQNNTYDSTYRATNANGFEISGMLRIGVF